MFDFGVSSIRRIKNAGSFDIKKITLLLGRNSSGKSTFLRSFPLLKQSIITRTSAPILWFGDFVDFGDFDNAVTDHEVDRPITFTFGVDHMPIESSVMLRDLYGVSPYFIGRDILPRSIQDLKYSVDVIKFKSKTRISKINIKIGKELVYKINISEFMKFDSFSVNDHEVEEYKEYFDFVITPDSIFPAFRRLNKKKQEALDEGIQFVGGVDRNLLSPMFNRALKILSDAMNSRISDDNKKIYTSFLLSIIPYNEEALLKVKKIFPTKAWEKFICYLLSEKGKKTFLQFEKYNAIFSINNIQNSIKSYFSPIMSSVLYIGPARAKSDRYYRYQDLSVSEIDPNGANFPMFLNSLSEPNLKKFSDWVQGLFGYGVNINRRSNHISINLKYKNDDLKDKNDDVNVIDTGYGVSQILPVLGQVWWAKNRPIRNFYFEKKVTVVAVEQPELHLHPAHQALLADAFVSGVKSKPEGRNQEVDVSYIIETHSEALINRLGELIYAGEFDAKDVQILIFDQDDTDKHKTIIKESYFDSEGILQNWPFGFFTPDAR